MTVVVATSLEVALDFLDSHPDCVVAAGTTDLGPEWQKLQHWPDNILFLQKILELSKVSKTGNELRIGSMLCHSDISRNELIGSHFPALSQAAASIGAPAVRNMGTLGGNLVNASPAADLPPALLVYDADVCLASKSGERRVPLSEFYLGYRYVAREANEILTAVILKVPKEDQQSSFIKFGQRRAQACSKLSLAVCLRLQEKRIVFSRIAAGSIAATPIRLLAAENTLLRKSLDDSLIQMCLNMAIGEISPIDDIRSTAMYRKHVLAVSISRILQDMMERVG